MSKKRPRGICRICGANGKLTFEHVPPGATYNKQSVNIINVKDWIEAEKQNNAMPWELEKVKGNISQRGKGGYYICERCNNNTGSWYGPYYKRFVNALMCFMQVKTGNDIQRVLLEIKEISPLPIIKQIMTMFCDINENLTKNDPSLKKFLMDKTNKSLNTHKYRVFMYLLKGQIERTIPLSALIQLEDNTAIMVSEISAVPVGFILYLDLPFGHSTVGTEITDFANYEYDDSVSVSLDLNINENNSWLPLDFRSKEEIQENIRESKQWVKDHEIPSGVQ